MSEPHNPHRLVPPELERHSVRLGPPMQEAKDGEPPAASDAAAVIQALAPSLGAEASRNLRPWLMEALAKGGSWWHSAQTQAGPAWITLTVLDDARLARHALLTLDRTCGEAALEARLNAARLDAMIRTAGALCHTVNNALTALLGNAEMLLETEDLPDEARSSAELILRAGERLVTLTSRTLRLGRARNPAAGRCDPSHHLAATSAQLQQGGPTTIKLDIPQPLGLGILLVDPCAFEEAAAHLLRNALKAAGPGGTVRLRAECEDGQGWPGFAWLRVTVEDDGPGLPRSELAFPGAGFLATGRRGTAHSLGLASVRAFATALGGTLQAADADGGGARVTLRLPVLEHEGVAT